MKYKDYVGSVHYSDEDNIFYGKVEYIRGSISFEREYTIDLKASFGDSIDVRDGSDLILPIDLFRPALDTEVLPIFSQVIKNNPSPPLPHYLQNFVRQVCKNYPEYFQKTS